MAIFVAWWVIALLAGALILLPVFPPSSLVETIALSLILGSTLSTIVGLGLYYLLSLNSLTSILSPMLLLVYAIAQALVMRQRTKSAIRTLFHKLTALTNRRLASGLFAYGLAGVVTWVLVTRIISVHNGQIYAGYAGVFGDLAEHTSLATSFVYTHKLPTQGTPLESGAALRYPFLPDFQAAQMLVLGIGFTRAFTLPQWLITWNAMTLMWYVAYRITKDKLASSLSLLLAIFAGNIGFLAVIPDACNKALGKPIQSAPYTLHSMFSSCATLFHMRTGGLLPFLRALEYTLVHMPRLYDGQPLTVSPLPQIAWWGATFQTMWAPQRNYTYGIAMLAAILALFLDGYTRGEKRTLLFAGLLGAMLPFYDPFTYIFLVSILIACFIFGLVSKTLGSSISFMLPAILLGMPQMIVYLTGPHGSLDNGPVSSNVFPLLVAGWLTNPLHTCLPHGLNTSTCTALYVRALTVHDLVTFYAHLLIHALLWLNAAKFWFINTSIFIPLSLLALAFGLHSKLRDSYPFNKYYVLSLVVGAWISFVLFNFVILTPDPIANNKLVSLWIVILSIPTGYLLAKMIKNPKLSWLGIVSALILTLSSILSLFAVLPWTNSHPPSSVIQPRYLWADKDAIAIASYVRQHTPVNAIFLTEGQPNDPVYALAGRTVYLAYYGWEYVGGQPLRNRLYNTYYIYKGCTKHSLCYVYKTLRSLRISYVELEPVALNTTIINKKWLLSHLKILIKKGSYAILAVPKNQQS